MALTGPDIERLGKLPEPAKVGSCGVDFKDDDAIFEAANSAGFGHAVVFVDPDNVASVLDSPAVQKLIGGMGSDFLFVDDHGKKRLRQDPLTLPVHDPLATLSPSTPGTRLRVVHLTAGGTLKGERSDLNNFKVPESWSGVGARLAPLMDQARLDNTKLGLVFDVGVDSHDLNIGTAIEAMARALGNASRTHDQHKSHPSEVFVGGAESDPDGDEVKHAKTLDETRGTTRRSIDIVYVSYPHTSQLHGFADMYHGAGDMVSRLQVASAFLAECPPRLMTAEAFVGLLKSVCHDGQLHVDVHSPRGTNGGGLSSVSPYNLEVLRAVHQGSPEAGPYMATVDYRGGSPDDPIDLVVAKTLTMDQGGVSLKPSAAQVGMQADMTGGATMLSILQRMAVERPKRNIRVVFGVASNRVDGTSYSPNDTYTLSSGLTVHILNCDAEGRLVMTDVGGAALQDLKAEERETGRIATIATLTGHAIFAWGPTTAIVGQNIAELRRIQDLAYEHGERFDYSPLLPLDYAAISLNDLGDLTNIPEGLSFGPGSARGAQSGAAFLAKGMGLSDEQMKRYVHFDIASTLDPFKADKKHNPALAEWGIPVGADYMATFSDWLLRGDR